jgi:predicted DNA-binding ribbon-helix-helix protein
LSRPRLVKRSFTIQGHRTSVALEPEFWDAFDAVAAARGCTSTALVTEIDEARDRPLASALRVFLLREAAAAR